MSFFRRLRRATLTYKLPYKNEPPYTHIVQIGDPVLRTPCAPVSRYDIHMKYVQDVVEQMKKVVTKNNLVGLSACQLGVRMRIIALNVSKQMIEMFSEEERKAIEIEQVPLQIWLNPTMAILDRHTVCHPEQCASVLCFSAHVKRYQKVSLTGIDEKGESKSLIASGWTARIIQHEMDHLDGKVYTDIMDPKTLTNTSWKKVNEYNGHLEIAYFPRL